MLLLLIKFAVRNIYRNFRRNLFTILSIAFGMIFLFWGQSILSGHNHNMVATVTSTFTGHLQLHKKNYLNDRQLDINFPIDPEVIAVFKQNNIPWAPRVYFPSIVSSGALSYPITLVGIDPTYEATITQVMKNITAGTFVSNTEEETTCTQPPLMISNRLAEKLGVGLGDKLVILGQDAQGSLGNNLFHLNAFFTSSSTDFDKYYVFTTLACAQNIASIEGVHELVVQSNDDEENILRLEQQFQPAKLLEFSTWKDMVPGVANMVRFNGAMSSLINFILFTVITLGVINSILMNIFERTKEIGIMLALGTTPNRVRFIIVVEAFTMAVIGTLLGSLIGLAIIWYHQRVGFDLSAFIAPGGRSMVGFSFPVRVHPIIVWPQYLKLVLLEIVFIVFAGFYPAWKASQIKPVETIRG